MARDIGPAPAGRGAGPAQGRFLALHGHRRLRLVIAPIVIVRRRIFRHAELLFPQAPGPNLGHAASHYAQLCRTAQAMNFSIADLTKSSEIYQWDREKSYGIISSR